MILSGFQTYAFSFFFKPMSEELDIGRGAISAVFLIRAVIMGFLALPVGMAVDRYGPRVLVVIGILIGGFATIGMAWISNLLGILLGIWSPPSIRPYSSRGRSRHYCGSQVVYTLPCPSPSYQ